MKEKTLCSDKPQDKLVIKTKYPEMKITIGAYHVDFYEKLLALPASARIQLLRLTENDINKFKKEVKESSMKFLKELISKNWFWRETGDPINEDTEFYEFNIKFSDLKKKVYSKRPMKTEDINKYINLFTSDKSDIYNKCEDF